MFVEGYDFLATFLKYISRRLNKLVTGQGYFSCYLNRTDHEIYKSTENCYHKEKYLTSGKLSIEFTFALECV